MKGNPSRFQSPTRPVEKVSWDDAQEFLQRINGEVPDLNLALPTEAQWEHACRAGTETSLYTGPIELLGFSNVPSLDPIAWYTGNSGVKFELDEGEDSSGWPRMQYPNSKSGTHPPVAKKKPNPWGLYDMIGNVWEWCAGGFQQYGEETAIDPAGPLETASVRVVRGGSWCYDARLCRSASRCWNQSDDRDYDLGFRCARVQS